MKTLKATVRNFNFIRAPHFIYIYFFFLEKNKEKTRRSTFLVHTQNGRKNGRDIRGPLTKVMIMMAITFPFFSFASKTLHVFDSVKKPKEKNIKEVQRSERYWSRVRTTYAGKNKTRALVKQRNETSQKKKTTTRRQT